MLTSKFLWVFDNTEYDVVFSATNLRGRRFTRVKTFTLKDDLYVLELELFKNWLSCLSVTSNNWSMYNENKVL